MLVLLTCFAVATALVPSALELPRFVETEAVLLAWCVSLWTTLSVTLYRGARLGDDHALRVRVADFGRKRRGSVEGELAAHVAGEALGCLAVEASAVAVAVAVFVIFAISASWLLVEFLFPALFFVAYTLLRAALTRVTNDTHGCEHSLPRALGWGLLWSAIYTAPLALVVGLIELGMK
jgi:hypothetical protein